MFVFTFLKELPVDNLGELKITLHFIHRTQLNRKSLVIRPQQHLPFGREAEVRPNLGIVQRRSTGGSMDARRLSVRRDLRKHR